MSRTVLPPEFLGRPALLEQLTAADDGLVMITAPAGYGKTSLLADWEWADPRTFVRIDPSAGPWRCDSLDRAVVIVIDDASRCCRPGSLASWCERLLSETPVGSVLAIAARRVRPAWPRLRAHGRLLEFGRRDLALTLGEADTLLRRVGCEAGVSVLEVVIGRDRRLGGSDCARCAREARAARQKIRARFHTSWAMTTSSPSTSGKR